MTTQQLAYVLFLSDELLKGMWVPNMVQNESALRASAAQELRRMHAQIEVLSAELDTLRTGYDAARLEIESLQQRVQELGQMARDVNSRRVVELESQLKAAQAQPAAQDAPVDADVQQDAQRLERERICAAIKAEDDYCVEHGDYMLDSDDCIKIVRGEWKRPEFADDAARAAQGCV